MKKKRIARLIVGLIMLLCMSVMGNINPGTPEATGNNTTAVTSATFENIPNYNETPYVIINENNPINVISKILIIVAKIPVIKTATILNILINLKHTGLIFSGLSSKVNESDASPIASNI